MKLRCRRPLEHARHRPQRHLRFRAGHVVELASEHSVNQQHVQRSIRHRTPRVSRLQRGHDPSPTSVVDNFSSPRVARCCSTALSTRAAASSSPTWASSSATDMIAAVGSAMPCPAMSGALPCTGSNIDGLVRVASMLPLAASPMPPDTAAARSVMMSPNRLSVTITSNRPGSVTMWMVAASMCW